MRTPKEILDRFAAAKDKRINFESTWQEIADHMLGLRDFNTFRTPGTERMRNIYDTTGLQAVHLLSGGLHGLVTNPATDWFSLRSQDERLMEDEDVIYWLDDATKVCLAAFQSPFANFTPQMAEFWIDLVAFGTGVPYVGDSDVADGPVFSTRPLSEIYVLEDWRGRVDTVFRKFKMTSRQIQQQFGEGASPRADKNVKKGKHEVEMCIVHVVFPSDEDTRGKMGRAAMPWASKYVSEEDSKILAESGFFEMPYMTARWSKEAGECYGRGPGFTALSDQRMLNEMGRTLIKAAQKAADPPLLVTSDGVISQVRTQPGGLTVIRAGVFKDDPVRPLQTGAAFGITEQLIAQRQQAVKNAFYSQMLQLFEDPRMTATQVLELSSQAQRLMAPMLGRLENELLEPMVDRVFGICMRRGKFLPIPEALRGSSIEVEYVSPVLRAQRTSEARSVLELWNAAQLMSQIDPTVLDNLSADTSIRSIAEALAVPVGVIRRKEDVLELRQAKAEQIAQEQQQQQALAVAETTAKLAPAFAKAQEALAAPAA